VSPQQYFSRAIPHAPSALRSAGHAVAAPWLTAIRGEYLEVPRLSLTRTQVQNLWDLEDDVCTEVLDELMASGFLRLTAAGGFTRS